ncbi:MAG: RNase adapter RapZ [Bryobacterales bacterium]|nr:RNase adapter RapZ [Bryobacterales bacterium]
MKLRNQRPAHVEPHSMSDLSSPVTDPTTPSLIIITGLSGSGKGTVLRSLEDLGYYAVDNLPVGLLPTFASLIKESPSIEQAAIVVDIRGEKGLGDLPEVFLQIRDQLETVLVFMDCQTNAVLRRYSETRRPHPLGEFANLRESIEAERVRLAPIRELADVVIDTSQFNVHELRDYVHARFGEGAEQPPLRISMTSFGFRHGVPDTSDLLFDVRFLPNPNYLPEFRHLTGLDPGVAEYIRGFPQTEEFIQRITELLAYLIPHYIREGKSYLTVSFGCTGGHHRSVMIAEEIAQRLRDLEFIVNTHHRDTARPV